MHILPRGRRRNSIRFKISIGILLITFSLLVLMIISNVYAVKVVHKQVSTSYEDMISLYMGQIDNGLEDAEQYLWSLMVTDENFNMIASMDNRENPDRILLAEVGLQKTLSSTLLINKTIQSFFVFSPDLDSLTDVFKQDSGFAERNLIRTYIKSHLNADSDFYQKKAASWFVQKVGGEYYLFRIMKSHSTYIGAWINMNTLHNPLEFINVGQDGAVLMTTDSGSPMQESPLLADHGIDLTKKMDGYYMTGKDHRYLVVGRHSNKGDFSLVAVIPDKKILENLPAWIKFDLLILAVFVLLLPGFFMFLSRTVLKPLQRMISAMRRFGDGETGLRIYESGVSDEFMILNQTFNRMASQIEELKIHVYEEKLDKQKAQLQHLQLQLNPHFFMNALNIIYTFARAHKFDLIQEMTLCLVRYFRYMFKSNLTFISLKHELEHVSNYLRIQEIRYPATLRYEIDVPEAFLDIKIPPLIIHTFVENTVKHEVSANDQVAIFIHADLDETESEPCLLLSIRDTGKGFSDEVLAELRQGRRVVDEQGEHIGIWNVIQRLKLLYDGNADISFANAHQETGAIIKMRLPIIASEEELADECADR